jgi:sec-independent protein translocase protein TatA
MYAHTLLKAGMLGGQELIVILIIVLVLFGGSKLPKLGDGLGKAIRNFRSSIGSDEGEGEAEVVDAQVVEPSQGADKQESKRVKEGEDKAETKKLDV